MDFGLPKGVYVNGECFQIRYDYRVILEILDVLNIEDATDDEKFFAALQMFYIDFEKITDYAEALKQLFIFINCGEEDRTTKKPPKLVDWAKDYPRIVAPINRIVGRDIRGIRYDENDKESGFHWWTLTAAYMEIGDCLFAQIVSIRNKKAKGKKLDKEDQEFYKANRDIIDIKRQYSEADNELLRGFI